MNAFETDLPPGTDAVPMARRALDVLRKRLSASVFDDARLLLSELVTNSVRHGDLTPAQTIHVRAAVRGGTLRVEVTDEGRGFTLRPRTASSAEDSGWGLYLVAQVADRWGVSSDGGSSVWFEIDARSEPGSRAGRRNQERTGGGKSAGRFEERSPGYRTLRPRPEAWGGPPRWRCRSEMNGSPSAPAATAPGVDRCDLRAPEGSAPRMAAKPFSPSTTVRRAVGSMNRPADTSPSTVVVGGSTLHRRATSPPVRRDQGRAPTGRPGTTGSHMAGGPRRGRQEVR
jgi:anti-sigma regulatory factor (Ser/Thr protein kinase)